MVKLNNKIEIANIEMEENIKIFKHYRDFIISSIKELNYGEYPYNMDENFIDNFYNLYYKIDKSNLFEDEKDRERFLKDLEIIRDHNSRNIFNEFGDYINDNKININGIQCSFKDTIYLEHILNYSLPLYIDNDSEIYLEESDKVKSNIEDVKIGDYYINKYGYIHIHNILHNHLFNMDLKFIDSNINGINYSETNIYKSNIVEKLVSSFNDSIIGLSNKRFYKRDILLFHKIILEYNENIIHEYLKYKVDLLKKDLQLLDLERSYL